MSVTTQWPSLDQYQTIPDLSDVSSLVSRQAFRALSSTFAHADKIRRFISPATAVVSDVAKLHRAGTVIGAADTLLHFLVEQLDEGDMATVNLLLGALRASVYDRANTDLYDFRGLARIHNVLALTLRSADKLPARAALRTAYRDAVTRSEGPAAADSAVALL